MRRALCELKCVENTVKDYLLILPRNTILIIGFYSVNIETVIKTHDTLVKSKSGENVSFIQDIKLRVISSFYKEHNAKSILI